MPLSFSIFNFLDLLGLMEEDRVGAGDVCEDVSASGEK
jgi:hypothetical protein